MIAVIIRFTDLDHAEDWVNDYFEDEAELTEATLHDVVDIAEEVYVVRQQE